MLNQMVNIGDMISLILVLFDKMAKQIFQTAQITFFREENDNFPLVFIVNI